MSKDRLEHPGRWLWLLLLVPILIGFSRLRLDVEVFNLLPVDLPSVQGLQIQQRYFANARELILCISADSAPLTEGVARNVATVLREHTTLVSAATWQPPWLERPEWAAELVGYLWLNQPPEEFSRLAQKFASTNLVPLLESSRETLATSMSPEVIGRLSYDPFGVSELPPAAGAGFSIAPDRGGFASADGKVRLVFVQAKPELASYQDCERWLQEIREIVERSIHFSSQGEEKDEVRNHSLRVAYTGRPAFVAEIAGGMQHDMTISVGGSAVIIAVLFYLWHRRVKPMLWLLCLLCAILGGTLGIGGLVYGSLNVVSLGFAAILLGLAVDYAVVHYQEAVANPGLSVPQVRRVIAPSIIWAAVTTVTAFLTLNFGGLPGLSQLGTLVAAGVLLASGVMVFEYLPPLFRSRVQPGVEANEPLHNPTTEPGLKLFWLGLSLVVLLAVVGALTFNGLPTVDPSAEPLRPSDSSAYGAMDLVRKTIGLEKDPFWLIVSGNDEQEVVNRLSEAGRAAKLAEEKGLIEGYTIPLALWPNPAFQRVNSTAAQQFVARESEFAAAAEQAGFAPPSLALLHRVLQTWSAATTGAEVFWPTNPMSSWVLEKFTARTATNFHALALLAPLANGRIAGVGELQDLFDAEGLRLTGWELLGESVYDRVHDNFPQVLITMLVVVLVSLWLAFKRLVEVALSVLALSLSFLCLLAVMRLAGWSWNLLNLMAVPLVLGTGVDYGIFMLLGLRRHDGDLMLTNRAVTRALLLCGATAVTGFGALAFSSNAGMASLGKVCAAGIVCNMAVALFLLPWWWLSCRLLTTRQTVNKPSNLYRAKFWRVGLWLARRLPYQCSLLLARTALALYWHLVRRRREIVISNLLPATDGNHLEAETAARRLYRNFAVKVTDLLRYEAGVTIEPVLGKATDWDLYVKARAQERGVLLITPHLGNWEFGAPFLTRQGEELQVITLAEPGRKFTELRQEARSRMNIKTIVIGEDPFAFLEIIRRLEGGATVALLIDRPPAASAVSVRLFGRDFSASIAAAELARASGCVLLPVFVPRSEGKYHAHLLPPIPYVRSELRDREARRQLTERILRAFEPVITAHLDQWYHFVPVWANNEGVHKSTVEQHP